jgi:hypothetical protein
MTECKIPRILPHKLQSETPISFIIGGLQYDGTFLESLDSVLRVRDPFEDSYIATRSVKASTIDPSKCLSKKEQRIELGSATETFRQILKDLLNTPILLQFGSTILSGTVIRVTNRSVTLNTASAITSGVAATKIALANVEVVLVPLTTSNRVRTGDPSFNITVRNQTVSVPTIAVFQDKP